jgi:hypothetical protein
MSCCPRLVLPKPLTTTATSGPQALLARIHQLVRAKQAKVAQHLHDQEEHARMATLYGAEKRDMILAASEARLSLECKREAVDEQRKRETLLGMARTLSRALENVDTARLLGETNAELARILERINDVGDVQEAMDLLRDQMELVREVGVEMGREMGEEVGEEMGEGVGEEMGEEPLELPSVPIREPLLPSARKKELV